MFNKYLIVILAILTLNLSMGAFVFAQTIDEKEKKKVEKIKRDVNQFGIGKDAKVTVTFKDGNKLQGYTSAIDESRFTVVAANGNSFDIQYLDVKEVRGKKPLAKGVQILIGVGVAFVALGIFGAICSQTCKDW